MPSALATCTPSSNKSRHNCLASSVCNTLAGVCVNAVTVLIPKLTSNLYQILVVISSSKIKVSCVC